jgi:magnesium-transporting ATPase (P-type)
VAYSPVGQLVHADIVLLELGVPADLWLVDVKNLRTDEAALTGESVHWTRARTRLPRIRPSAIGSACGRK